MSEQAFRKTKGEYIIDTDPALIDRELVHRYLSNESYWAKGVPFEIVSKSIDHSLCFGLYHGSRQIGFARMVTDRATFTYLADVFILEEERGKGLSKWMMQEIDTHPDLQGLRRWMLGTRDAHVLYEQFGWTVITEEQRPRFMQRHFPEVYRSEKAQMP